MLRSTCVDRMSYACASVARAMHRRKNRDASRWRRVAPKGRATRLCNGSALPWAMHVALAQRPSNATGSVESGFGSIADESAMQRVCASRRPLVRPASCKAGLHRRCIGGAAPMGVRDRSGDLPDRAASQRPMQAGYKASSRRRRHKHAKQLSSSGQRPQGDREKPGPAPPAFKGSPVAEQRRATHRQTSRCACV